MLRSLNETVPKSLLQPQTFFLVVFVLRTVVSWVVYDSSETLAAVAY